MTDTIDILKRAKAASLNKPLETEIKNNALLKMAECLINSSEEILLANAKDVENAKGKIADVMIDRLRLDFDRIKAMAKGISEVAALPDPVVAEKDDLKPAPKMQRCPVLKQERAFATFMLTNMPIWKKH